MDGPVSNQQLLDLLLPEVRQTRETAQETRVQVVQIGERLKEVAAATARLEAAVYGNGVPGIKAVQDDLKRRIEALERRHASEDEARKKEAEAVRSEWRKYKWGILSAVTVMVVDIVLRVIGVGR